MLGVGSDEASVAKLHEPVIFLTDSGFHREGCRWLTQATEPHEGQLWQTFYLLAFPCRTCWSPRFIERWQKGLRVRHQNCAPHVPLVRMPNRSERKQKPTVGRPRSLSPMGLQRVLSMSRAESGPTAIVSTLRTLGIDTSRGAVQRAIKRKPPYDDPEYDYLYER